jgi:hypothetical protein
VPAREQRHEQRVDHLLVSDDDAANLRADPPTSVRGTLEQQGVTAADRRKGCQGLAFVLQACPMGEAHNIPLAYAEPALGERVVVERPPPGLGRGLLPVSPLVVVLVTLGLVLLTAGYYALRLRRARRR